MGSNPTPSASQEMMVRSPAPRALRPISSGPLNSDAFSQRTDHMKSKGSGLKRMDNVLIVVDDLEAAKAFFAELGMELEGETTVEGPWVDSTVGLDGVRADITTMRTPDG